MSYPRESSPVQAAVTSLLLRSHPTLLHVDEIRREVDHDIGVDEALDHLHRAGLVHELEGFYWTTVSAMAAEEAVTAHMIHGDLDEYRRDRELAR